MTIAVTHPGKIGDALYALPFARLMYGIHGEKIDFYTSEYCKPMQSLVEYQSYINRFIIPKEYVVERMDCGVQPWNMPVSGDYTYTFHCGFKSVPDTALHQFIAKQNGYDIPLAIKYEYPGNHFLHMILQEHTKEKPYICIAPRGKSSFQHIFNEVADRTNAVIIGAKDDYTGHGIDMTGLSFLDTLSVLSKCDGFVGLMSSMLVLANGFNMPRIAIHDGRSWDMRHVIYTEYNHYPINPSVDDIVAILDK